MEKKYLFEKLLPGIVELSKEAGKAIMEIYRLGDLGTTYKDGGSPLTLADTAAHNIILKQLKKVTPAIPVISEESRSILYKDRREWNLFWLVDPLDGTKEFIKGNGEFTVNIALIENGIPIMGVVHAPELALTYYATKHDGAFRQAGEEGGVMISVCGYGDDKGKVKIVVSRSHRGETLEKFLQNIKDYECVSVGSSLKLCLVAEGAAHIYPRLGPTMEWDTAAAQCIVSVAGGTVNDLQNKPLRYNKADQHNPFFVVCGTPPFLWKQYLDI